MKPFSEQRKSPKWQKRRLEVMEAAGWRCEECGSQTNTLNVHHELYIPGRAIWNYEDQLLTCLCELCHEKRQGRQQAVHLGIARILRTVPTERLERMAWWLLKEAEKQP